jgi:hypothetical protein
MRAEISLAADGMYNIAVVEFFSLCNDRTAFESRQLTRTIYVVDCAGLGAKHPRDMLAALNRLRPWLDYADLYCPELFSRVMINSLN